jgi:ketosteroid isomerase-like protein
MSERMSTTQELVRNLDYRWARAEEDGDVAALDALTTDDFTLVGPVGFVLDKRQWLARYGPDGALVTHALVWEDATIREYGDTAVAVGVLEQKAEFQGRPVDGRFRVTRVNVRQGDRWLLAGLHYSPIGGPPPFANGGAR